MNRAVEFYQTVSGVSFTLLGLWFTVVQFAHGGWRSDPWRQRSALHIGLHFLLPGTVALAALLSGSTDGGLIWRTAFVLGGVAGLIESLSYLSAPGGRVTLAEGFLRITDPALYTLMAAAALLPTALLAVTPLQIEGMVTGLLFVSGLCSVWLAFAEREPV